MTKGLGFIPDGEQFVATCPKLSTARATGCQQFKSNESNGDYKLTSSCFVGESDFHAQILRDDVKIRPPQKWWSVTSEWARLLQRQTQLSHVVGGALRAQRTREREHAC